MDDRGHDWDQGPPEAAPASPPVASPEPVPDQPPCSGGDRQTPVDVLPRAAGGGAGAVVAPAVVIAEAVPPPAEASEPVAAQAEAPLAATPGVEAPPVEIQFLEAHPPETPLVGAVALATQAPTVEVHALPQPPAIAEAPPPGPAAPPPLPAFVPPARRPVPEPPRARERIEPIPPPIVEREPIEAGSPGSETAGDIWRTEAALEAPAARSEPRPFPRSTLRRALGLAGVGLAALAGVVLFLVVLYRWVDPPASTLMLGQRLTGTSISQTWVPLERISPNLIAAVILSEDAAFCRHRGVDWGELREAIETASDGVARGGSTISMQVVKNLFLWPSRSYVRKAIEFPLTYAIEAAWSKPRILEIYLNIAEWGPGVFGAEAAARYHFRKSAYLLNPREAALLAVSLPNPFDRQAGRPGPGTARLAENLLMRMRAGQGNTACVRPRPARG